MRHLPWSHAQPHQQWLESAVQLGVLVVCTVDLEAAVSQRLGGTSELICWWNALSAVDKAKRCKHQFDTWQRQSQDAGQQVHKSKCGVVLVTQHRPNSSGAPGSPAGHLCCTDPFLRLAISSVLKMKTIVEVKPPCKRNSIITKMTQKNKWSPIFFGVCGTFIQKYICNFCLN